MVLCHGSDYIELHVLSVLKFVKFYHGPLHLKAIFLTEYLLDWFDLNFPELIVT